MKKNFISLLFVSAITVGLLSACSSAPADDNATNPKAEAVTSQANHDTNSSPVSVTLNEVAHSIFYAPQYVAIENGYFADEGINLTLVTGFGADKVMTAVLSGEADIGFMGSESSIYTYQEGANDVIKNFAQLTQRAGNFLVAREEMPDFSWDDLKGKDVLGGRKGGMPEMVFEYILKKNGINPQKDLSINQSIDFGSTAAAFSGGQADYTIEFEPSATALEAENSGYVVASLGVDSGYVPYTAYSAKTSYLNANPNIIQKFQCPAKRNGFRSVPHSGRDCKSHCTTVQGNRSRYNYNHCQPLLRTRHLEIGSDLQRRKLQSAAGYSGKLR